ncbi:MAG: hypothetical protein GY832_30760 [Chloroflexi bacterium]|nr:hypothetical protein [Chloroflexota bacterium]
MIQSHLFNLSSLIFVVMLIMLGGVPVSRAQPRSAVPILPDEATAEPLPILASAPTEPSDHTTQSRFEESFGQLPLYFVENQGQLDKRVAYYIQGSDKTIYFTSEGVTFTLTDHQFETTAHHPLDAEHRPPESTILPFDKAQDERQSPGQVPDPLSKTKRWVVKLDFVNANPDIRPIGQKQTEAVVSYFEGTPDEWHAGLPTYSRIVYTDLWPGIDLVYYGTVNQLKYEFIVHPGTDPAQIRLAYRGATDVTLNAAGQLEVSTPVGGFTDNTPVAYQEINGRRVPVEMAYQLANNESQPSDLPFTMHNVQFGFSVGPYDLAHPLILDPTVLVYCGYIGGSGYDEGYGIAVDEEGYVYVTGRTDSSEATFPVTVGPDLTHNGGSYDAFVAKVNATGSALVYAGYIGGSGYEYGYGIAVDGVGDAYITGSTWSSEATFPVTVGPDLTHNGTSDAFVAKVKSDGTSLVYCGYIGGSDGDYGRGIAVDGAGNVLLIGNTNSSEATFPVTMGPDLTYNSGVYDAFVVKVGTDGTSLVYAGYIGGSGYDSGYGIKVDGAGNAYVTGSTSSSEATFPVTVGPDLTYNGSSDAFVAKVASDGTSLLYCGYIGGSHDDYGRYIAVDGLGNAYVTGQTNSSEATFPVTVGPDLTYNGDQDLTYNDDAFIAKVASDGTSLLYCGYIGGSGYDEGYGIAVDGAGYVYVTGRSNSSEATFPVTVGPDLTYNGGSHDAFVTKVESDGTSLVYCGYIGGSGYDYGSGIAVDGAGNTYVTGSTQSKEATFPATVGPDLTYNGGSYDAFVAKVQATAPPVGIIKTVAPQGSVMYGNELTYTLVISAAMGVQVVLGDPLTDTAFSRFVEQPAGITHSAGIIAGTLAMTSSNWITVSFVVRVGVPGTVGWTVDISNHACVYLVSGTLGDCIWSEAVTNEAFRPYDAFLPLVMRADRLVLDDMVLVPAGEF